MNLDQYIRKVPNFPKPGILFYDVTSIFVNPLSFNYVIDQMLDIYKSQLIDGVIAIESRGFLLASAFCYTRKIPLILARKKGKLPLQTVEQSYDLEYGSATLQIHIEDLPSDKKYLIVDDLIATGGTLKAVASMVEKQQSAVAGIFSIIGLPFLNYESKIGNYRTTTLINYNAEHV